jgi:RNA polymerase-binding transcription factor DksA
MDRGVAPSPLALAAYKASRDRRACTGAPRARARALAAIERAERRLEQGTYGLSVESGQPIPDARLEAMPWAERIVAEQARYDRGVA